MNQGSQSGDLGEQVRGAAQDAAGKVEQGADNLGDTLSGRQRDLEGQDRTNPVADTGREAQHLGKDMERTARDWANDADPNS
jgi:hypothetical protein